MASISDGASLFLGHMDLADVYGHAMYAVSFLEKKPIVYSRFLNIYSIFIANACMILEVCKLIWKTPKYTFISNLKVSI